MEVFPEKIDDYTINGSRLMKYRAKMIVTYNVRSKHIRHKDKFFIRFKNNEYVPIGKTQIPIRKRKDIKEIDFKKVRGIVFNNMTRSEALRVDSTYDIKLGDSIFCTCSGWQGGKWIKGKGYSMIGGIYENERDPGKTSLKWIM